MWWPLVFYTLYASCAGLAESGITQCEEKVAELVPPDAPADVSPTDLAFCWQYLQDYSNLQDPAKNKKKSSRRGSHRLRGVSA